MAVFDNNDNDSDHVCDMPTSFVADAPDPYVGNLSFRQLNMIISGSCTVFVCLVIFALMFRHATHFSKPNEQTKILKICLMLPMYNILSFIGIAWPNSYIYVSMWRDFWEGIALASFFLLLCEFVSPSADFRDVFFAALEVPEARKAKEKGKPVKMTGLEWYRKRWITVFQYVPVALIVAIATDITQAVNKYCLESSSIHFAHIWLTIIHSVSLFLAVISCVKFYTALKKDIKHHRPLAKFLAFKLVIALTLIQEIVFTILRSTNVLEESNTMTYADVNFGIDTMTTCILMVPFAVFFHYAYSVSPYDVTKPRMLPLSEIPPQYDGSSDRGSGEDFNARRHMVSQRDSDEHYYGGPLGIKAWLAVFDPREIIRAIIFAFTMKKTASGMKRSVVGVTAPTTEGAYEYQGYNDAPRY